MHTINILQLALCLWTTGGSWPTCTESLREKLYIEGTSSFASAQIAGDAAKCIEIFQTLYLDEERPAKRRKTRHESSEDINTSTYHELTRLLNGSTQESPVFNLSNLHSIVRYVIYSWLTGYNLPYSGRHTPRYQTDRNKTVSHKSRFLLS
jgi:serine/threonine-protein kinase ATR